MAYRWAKPKESRRFHIFRDLSYRSLCGHWATRTDDDDELVSDAPVITPCKADCRRCVKERNKIMKCRRTY